MRPMVDSFLDLGHRIEGLPVPTLAAVHGVQEVAVVADRGHPSAVG